MNNFHSYTGTDTYCFYRNIRRNKITS